MSVLTADLPSKDSMSTLLRECNNLYDELSDLPSSQEQKVADQDSKKKRDDSCPICCSTSILQDGIISICADCGIEIDQKITDTAEWRSFDEDKATDRCGLVNNMLLYESSLSTNIAASHFSSSQQRKLLNRLQLWQLMPSKERTLRDDFNHISYACGDKVPKCVVEYAQVLFKMAEDSRQEEEEGHRADIRTGLLAAAVFYASKIHEYARSYKEIASWFGIDETYVTTGIKIFFRLMCNKIGMTNLITDHKSYVDKFCNNLGLSNEVRSMAHEISNKAVTLGILRDNTPTTIAAACIYFVINMYGLNISKALVAKRSAVSEITIGKAYQKLNSYLEYLL